MYLYFVRFRRKAGVSLKRSSKYVGGSKNIDDMLTKDLSAKLSPATAPPTPVAKPSSGLAGPSSPVNPETSAMEIDINPNLDVSGSVDVDVAPSC